VAISICMIPLAKDFKLSAQEIQRDLAATWPGLPAAGKPEKKENTLAFRLGDADVIMGHMPAPIPWSDLEGPCATSWLWPKSAEELRSHAGHLIVTVMADKPPLERAKLLSIVAASIVHTCQGAIGVYWGDATLVIPGKLFREFAAEMLPAGLPLYIWIDFRIGRSQEGGTCGFTTGMEALGHMEFETLQSPEPPGELRERLFGLACYLIENGPVIRDGDTFGESADERIKVIYSQSAFGNPKQVMRLDYGGAGGKKPWWKVW